MKPIYTIRLTKFATNTLCPIRGEKCDRTKRYGVFLQGGNGVLCEASASELAPELWGMLVKLNVRAEPGANDDCDFRIVEVPAGPVGYCPYTGQEPLLRGRYEVGMGSGGNLRMLAPFAAEDLTPELTTALHDFYGTKPQARPAGYAPVMPVTLDERERKREREMVAELHRRSAQPFIDTIGNPAADKRHARSFIAKAVFGGTNESHGGQADQLVAAIAVLLNP